MEDMEYWECRRKEIERCMWNAYREILDEYSNLIFSRTELCAKNVNSRWYIWGNIYFRFTFTRTIFRLFNDFENCSLNSFLSKQYFRNRQIWLPQNRQNLWKMFQIECLGNRYELLGKNRGPAISIQKCWFIIAVRKAEAFSRRKDVSSICIDNENAVK